MNFKVLAWAIIPLRFEFRVGHFFFGSWKLFILVTAVPLHFFAILLIFMPETPQHFAKIGHYEELLNVLTRMYRENHGSSSEDYIASENKFYPIVIFLYDLYLFLNNYFFSFLIFKNFFQFFFIFFNFFYFLLLSVSLNFYL